MSKKNVPNETGAPNIEAANSSKIDVIRDLIFGENMSEYNSEFDNLKKDLEKKRQELKDMMEEIRTELSKDLDNLATDLNIRISDLEQNLEEKTEDLLDRKVEKETLGEFLIELGEKIRKR